MFVIVNHENRVIAASPEILERAGAASIYELLEIQERGGLTVDTERGELLFGPESQPLSGTFESLPSLLGSLQLFVPEEHPATVTPSVSMEETEELPPVGEMEKAGVSETVEEAPAETGPLSRAEDEELLDLLFEEETPVAEEEKPPAEAAAETPEELLSIGEEEAALPPVQEETPEEASLQEEAETPLQEAPVHEETAETSEELLPELELPEETTEKLEVEEALDWRKLLENFHLNLDRNASHIELTADEYSELIREFIEESQSLREDLEAEEPFRRHQASTALKDATTLLQLEPLPQFFQILEKSHDYERPEMIREFYKIIDRLKEELSEKVTKPEIEAGKAAEMEETAIPAPEAEGEIREEVAIPVETEEEVAAPQPAPTIHETEETEAFLRDVKMVPIEFSLKIASEELNLPEDLVLEFINDFAAQGHEYLPVLVDAYQNGDLDKLQKTAHMLKGAASNLRIEPMVENLYELQFDNDISRAPKRIKLFAGQLMSLDNYLAQMNGQ